MLYFDEEIESKEIENRGCQQNMECIHFNKKIFVFVCYFAFAEATVATAGACYTNARTNIHTHIHIGVHSICIDVKWVFLIG